MNNSIIQFKDDSVFIESVCVGWHPKLIVLLYWIKAKFYLVLITSAFRKGTGVHGTTPLRALDLRARCYHNPKEVVGIINKNWIYDSKRPHLMCALFHDTGNGVHIHIQVHPNTYKIEFD